MQKKNSKRDEIVNKSIQNWKKFKKKIIKFKKIVAKSKTLSRIFDKN